MFNWFSRTEKFYGDFAFLAMEMHSHLLPGIDDGAQTVEDTIRLIEHMRSLGWKGAITTPHIMSDLYPNNKQTIESAFAQIQDKIPKDFKLSFAAEYMVDEYFGKTVAANEPLLSFGDNHVLIEMSYLGESQNIKEMIFQLRIKGYRPILAHPERYVFYHRSLQKIRDIKDMGCDLQLNLLSLIGYYGSAVKHVAEKLLSEHLYDFAGTDLHHDKHAQALTDMRARKLMRNLGSYPFRNIELL